MDFHRVPDLPILLCETTNINSFPSVVKLNKLVFPNLNIYQLFTIPIDLAAGIHYQS